MAATPEVPTGGKATSWLERRTRIAPLLQASLHVRIPMSAKTYYFGGIALFLFGIQAATGTLLALYYKPTPEAAYKSVQFITSDVSFGWLIRSVHHWAANLMILFVVLHLVRVYMQAAYKYLLLMVTLAFGFTGYLLPWDQLAYWATVVGTEIAGSVPVIGDTLLLLLRGGADVTGDTMTRFFGIHVLVLPIALAALLAVHLILGHQLGLANPKRPEPRVTTPEFEKEPQRPFFPHYLLDELMAWYVLLAILVVLASVFPAGLEEQANPLQTPAHTKPEWYYLGVYQLLKVIPIKVVGIMVPIVGVALLVVWPFLDRNPEVVMRRRKIAVAGATVVIVGLIVFTIWGYVS
jgi:ubiquinol-cytochrome c reductase cytochrome b subunit